jgi:RNA polymerase sigma factor (sigma-70 family)
MATGRLGDVLQHLRQTTAWRGEASLTDGQLLGHFLADRDEASFAALVRRHGPLVWGTVRRALRNTEDAEDAFQATFLVLARKAASVLPREQLAGWLYGVAYNTARKARALADRRRGRERQVAEMPTVPVPPPEPKEDWLPLLDQELSGLPEKYRTALALCDLEGRPRKEAARQLGVPEGTLSARLTRGRRLLARRLARRGLTLSGAALAANAAAAPVPAPLVSATITAATGVAPLKVAALAEGVLKAMLLARLQQTGAALLLAAALAAAVGFPCWAGAPVAPNEAQGAHARDRQPMPARKTPGAMAPEQSRRMLRWRIVFDTHDGEDYARQLEALGAVLAVPTGEGNKYAVIRDLGKRPVKPVAEDLSRVRHIFWLEEDPRSVGGLAKALGLKKAPGHVVVFLPKYVEDVLLRKELAHAGRKEENIEETTFRFERTKDGYKLRVSSQRARGD